MPLILPGNVGSATAATGYDVANSCRFNDDDSAYMHKTCGSAFNTDRWTISLWFKRGNLGIDTRLISCDNDDGSNDDYIRFDSSDQMEFMIYEGSSIVGLLKPNMVFRDVSAWYHLVCVWDSANGTAGNRMRMYVNGTEVTSFETDTNPSEGVNASWGNTSHPIEVGRRGSANNQYFDGYMAEVAVCDGQAYAASDFGEFDEDSGIWKPIDVSGLTFGTSGFYLDFQASGNLGNDANGGTDLTEVNLAATDQSTDTCTNNFATLNPLYTNDGAITYSEGNLKAVAGSGSTSWTTRYAFSTIGVSAGRWYVEAKCVDSGGSNQFYFGVGKDLNTWAFSSSLGYESTGQGWGYYASNGNIVNNESDLYTSGNSYTDGDIISMELDLEDMTLDFYKNGAKEGYQITSLPAGTYHFAINGYAAIDGEFNFGSPPHAISSGNTDGNGHGNFEYSVPSGHFALCTKNLAEYG